MPPDSAYPFSASKLASLPQVFDPRSFLRRLDYVERLSTHLTKTISHLHIKESTVSRVDYLTKEVKTLSRSFEELDDMSCARMLDDEKAAEKGRILEARLSALEERVQPRRRKRKGKERLASVASPPSTPKTEKVDGGAPAPVMIFWDSENCNIKGQLVIYPFPPKKTRSRSV